LDVHGINDIRQKEMHITEPFVPEIKSFEVEATIEELEGIYYFT
jgi:hypothetical protein